VRLALKVVMQNDGDFVDVILLFHVLQSLDRTFFQVPKVSEILECNMSETVSKFAVIYSSYIARVG
jgi:hypothetical protein